MTDIATATLKTAAPGSSPFVVCLAATGRAKAPATKKAKASKKKSAGKASATGESGSAKLLGDVPADLTRAVAHGGFDGARFQTFDLAGRPGENWRHVTVIGVGDVKSLNGRDLLRIGGIAAQAARRAQVDSFDLLVPADVADKSLAYGSGLELLTEGALLGTYRYTLETRELETLPADVRVCVGGSSAAHGKAVDRANQSAAGVALARDLSNTPAMDCTPSCLAETAKEMAAGTKGAKKAGKPSKKVFVPPVAAKPAGSGLKVTVYDRPWLEKNGFGGILGVNHGSRHSEPARLIIFEYKAKAGAPTVCFVGKGITFDSGGYSIKPMPGMANMKIDMSGASAVFGIMKTVSLRKPGVNVIGVVPTTENMIHGDAYRPGDVLRMYSGKTVEIGNTDAEGRLILADALAYASGTIKPDVMVDFATLTGACMVALGGHASGVMTDSDALADDLIAAGEATGDRAWRLPLWKEYGDQLKSKIADLNNVGGRGGGACSAGYFLRNFVDVDNIDWAHVDIAGCANKPEGGNPWAPPGATGYGVRLGLGLLDRLADAKPGKGKKKARK